MLLLWVGMVVTATILVSSVSFALGTLFPRQSTLVKIGDPAGVVRRGPGAPWGWSGQTGSPAWYSAWDPTSATTARESAPGYGTAFSNLLNTTTDTARFQEGLVAIENTVPGTWPGWLPI